MIVNGYSEQIDTRRMIADIDVNMASPDILRQDLGSLGGVDPERAFVRTSQPDFVIVSPKNLRQRV